MKYSQVLEVLKNEEQMEQGRQMQQAGRDQRNPTLQMEGARMEMAADRRQTRIVLGEVRGYGDGE